MCMHGACLFAVVVVVSAPDPPCTRKKKRKESFFMSAGRVWGRDYCGCSDPETTYICVHGYTCSDGSTCSGDLL